MRRRALIVGASPVPGGERFYADVLRRAELVIAADAAGEWCVGAGRVPDVVEGDFDSSGDGAAEALRAAGAVVHVHPADKDASDLDLCVSRARVMGARAVTLTAVTGGRPDHWLAALGTLGRAADLDGTLLEPGSCVHVLSGTARHTLELDLARDAAFSVVALEASMGVSIRGAAFPLDGAGLPALSSLGISNRAVGGRVSFEVREGVLLVMVPCAVG